MTVKLEQVSSRMKKGKAGDWMQPNQPTEDWQRLPRASVTAERQYVGIKYTIYLLLIGTATVVQVKWLDLSPWWMWILAGSVDRILFTPVRVHPEDPAKVF